MPGIINFGHSLIHGILCSVFGRGNVFSCIVIVGGSKKVKRD